MHTVIIPIYNMVQLTWRHHHLLLNILCLVLPYMQYIEINRQHQHTHRQGREEGNGNAHALVKEERTSHSANEYQWYENTASGKHRTQHGSKDTGSALAYRLLQLCSASLLLQDIIYHDNGVVYNHTHTQD